MPAVHSILFRNYSLDLHRNCKGTYEQEKILPFIKVKDSQRDEGRAISIHSM
jgi:hypothetical protein